MTSASETQRSFLALTLFAVAGLAVLIGLGAWQLQRLDEKSSFLKSLASEAKAAPQTAWASTAEFGRVALTGQFMPGKTAFVRVTLPDGNSTRLGGLGLYVITPLMMPDGAIILVNRGFIRTGFDNRAPVVETPQGLVTITGFKRPPEPRNWFSVPDDLARLVFAVRDPVVISASLGVGADAAAFLEAERGHDAPVAGSPQGVDSDELLERIPNNHLQYAITWFGLAATLVGVYLAMVLVRRREANS